MKELVRTSRPLRYLLQIDMDRRDIHEGLSVQTDLAVFEDRKRCWPSFFAGNFQCA